MQRTTHRPLKTARLELSLTEEQEARIRSAAARSDLSVSQFLRCAALERANQPPEGPFTPGAAQRPSPTAEAA